MFSVLVIRLRSLRLLRVSGIVMRLRMFLLLITFLKASHSFRNRLLVICKNAYLFATMIKIGRAVQQECRDRSRMPSSARKKKGESRGRLPGLGALAGGRVPRAGPRARYCGRGRHR